MTNICINYQYFFNKNQNEGFFIGLKTGYKYAPNRWNFTASGNHLENAPGLNMDGFYLSVILGGGSLMAF
jgi:hypothetical protein